MRALYSSVIAAALLALLPSDAHAYIGPGAGLSAFGALLALVVTFIVAIFGFVWYPIKRLARSLKRKRDGGATVPDKVAT